MGAELDQSMIIARSQQTNTTDILPVYWTRNHATNVFLKQHTYRYPFITFVMLAFAVSRSNSAPSHLKFFPADFEGSGLAAFTSRQWNTDEITTSHKAHI